MLYVATCSLVLWYMAWNGNSIGQIGAGVHVPQNVFCFTLFSVLEKTEYNLWICLDSTVRRAVDHLSVWSSDEAPTGDWDEVSRN